MKLSSLLYGIEIEETNIRDFGMEVSGIVSDSRKAGKGDVFVCIAGLKNNGHDYIAQAFEKGVCAAIIEESTPFCCRGDDGAPARYMPYVRVRGTRAALANLWYNFCRRPADVVPTGTEQSGTMPVGTMQDEDSRAGRRMKIIAVTGTNGKTTTTYMLRSIFTEAGFRTGLIGTINNPMTTPDPELFYPELRNFEDEGTEYLIMEASSHALALDKLAPLKFAAGVFTNLTPEHLDFHGDMDGYRAAKAKLFAQCEKGIFNYDDLNGRLIADGAPCEKYFYSAETKKVCYSATDIKYLGLGGVEYTLNAPKCSFLVKSPLQGRFTVYNSLSAASCALSFGVKPETIRRALIGLKAVPGRLERVPLKRSDIAVFIDYAHTPDALENVLRTMRSFMPVGSRLILLFGCGGDRDRTKRPVMGRIASAMADFVIVTSDNSRSEEPAEIIREILKGIDKESPYTVIESRRDAIFYALKTAGPGDVILLAGKGHEDYEITADGKHPFSEKEIIRQAEESEGI